VPAKLFPHKYSDTNVSSSNISLMFPEK